MRAKLMWVLLVVILVVTPALVGVLFLGADDSVRRLGAGAGVGTATFHVARVDVSFDGAPVCCVFTTANWGFDRPAGSKIQYRLLVLKRNVWSRSFNEFLDDARRGLRYESARVTLYSTQGTSLGTYQLSGASIASYENDTGDGNGGGAFERLGLRYEDMTFTPN